jgi:hypothetical protein
MNTPLESANSLADRFEGGYIDVFSKNPEDGYLGNLGSDRPGYPNIRLPGSLEGFILMID